MSQNEPKNSRARGPVEKRAEMLQRLRQVGKIWQKLLLLLGRQKALYNVDL